MYEMFVMLRIRNRRFSQIIRFFISYLITYLTQLFSTPPKNITKTEFSHSFLYYILDNPSHAIIYFRHSVKY